MVKKVLVVDDDHATLHLVKRALALKGYKVFCASDGLDALVQIKKEKPDLVILDVMMPEINGYDVCYQLRFNKDFEQVPIILLTNRDQELDDSFSQRLKIEYLSKPFDTQVLLKKVETLL